MRSVVLPLCCVAAVLAACSGEPTTAPERLPPPDLRGYAFRLALDLEAGTVQVGRPGTSSRNASIGHDVSLSLLGDDAISVESQLGVTCLPTKNPTQKLCTFELEVTNELRVIDLMTPTAFPRPPEGTSGILVFPFSASSDGTGGWAFPSADWDLGPVNFFNDFDPCSSGSKTDCYRYELISAPLYAGQSGYLPQVGFAVPTDAQNITAYVVVAADLRENPPVTLSLSPINQLCGVVNANGYVAVDTSFIRVAEVDPVTEVRTLGFCAFRRDGLPSAPLQIFRADLRLRNASEGTGRFYTEPLDYGATLDAADYGIPSPPSQLLTSCCFLGPYYAVIVTSAVQNALDQGLPRFPFRMTPFQTEWALFFGSVWSPPSQPELVVTYRLK